MNPNAKASDANSIARHYLDQIQVEMRIIDSVKADTTFELFGKTFSGPIMTPPFSHLRNVKENGLTPMEEYAIAANQLQLVNWIGMESNELFDKVLVHCPNTIRIIKPYADHKLIYHELYHALAKGALAVGMDIDHVFHGDGEYDVVDDITLGPVTVDDLKEYVDAAKAHGIPFVAKGVLSVTDAVKCRDAGCAAIVVSHHHGRIPFGVPPLRILPEIKQAVGDTMKIFVDCSIDDGYDAFKALALGADAVCPGHALLTPLSKEGTEGAVQKLSLMNRELMNLMEHTNCPTLDRITKDVLYLPTV